MKEISYDKRIGNEWADSHPQCQEDMVDNWGRRHDKVKYINELIAWSTRMTSWPHGPKANTPPSGWNEIRERRKIIKKEENYDIGVDRPRTSR